MIDFKSHITVLMAQEHQLLSDSREFLEEVRERALATCRALYLGTNDTGSVTRKNNELIHKLDEEISRLDTEMRRHIRHD